MYKCVSYKNHDGQRVCREVPLSSEEKVAVEQRKEARIGYKEKRRDELSGLDGEGLDAIRREIAAIRAGEPETVEYKSYREKVEGVKKRNPKPEKGEKA